VISQINSHTYDDRGGETLRYLAAREKKKLWMSEVCQGAQRAGHDHDGIQSPLDLCLSIAKNLNEMKPCAWIYWYK
jgi:O-glycosyl hydrolase